MDLRGRVGRNIRREREAKGLLQEELAHVAELHVTYLSGIETGKRNITLNVFEKIANALGVSEAHLVRSIDDGGETSSNN